MRTIAALLILVLIGLGGAPTNGVAQSPELVVAQGIDPETVDPHASYTTATMNVYLHMFDGLLHRAADLAIKPALATAWRSVDDNTWEFDLRRGVTFHDGSPFTAEDVKFSFERVFNPTFKSPLAPNVNAVTRVDVVDPHRVRLLTKSPYPILPARLTVFPIVPAKYVRDRGDAEDLDALLLAARGSLDPEARKRHYHKALALIREEAPMIFLHRQVDVYGVSKRVAWKPRSDERIWLVEAALKGDSR